MKKAELKKIFSAYNIDPYEFEDVVDCVRDVIAHDVEELEKNEPYAVATIRRGRHALEVLSFLAVEVLETLESEEVCDEDL